MSGRVIVYERLSFDDEKSHAFTLEELASSSYEFGDLSIMVIFRPGGESHGGA